MRVSTARMCESSGSTFEWQTDPVRQKDQCYWNTRRRAGLSRRTGEWPCYLCYSSAPLNIVLRWCLLSLRWRPHLSAVKSHNLSLLHCMYCICSSCCLRGCLWEMYSFVLPPSLADYLGWHLSINCTYCYTFFCRSSAARLCDEHILSI